MTTYEIRLTLLPNTSHEAASHIARRIWQNEAMVSGWDVSVPDGPDTDEQAPVVRASDDPEYDEAEQQEAEKSRLPLNIYDLWCAVNDAEQAANTPDTPWSEWREHFTWERAHDIYDREVYRGGTTLEGGELEPPAGFRLVESFCDEPYRFVWANRKERVILTYCEGDLSYEIAADDEGFRREFLSAADFYRDH